MCLGSKGVNFCPDILTTHYGRKTIQLGPLTNSLAIPVLWAVLNQKTPVLAEALLPAGCSSLVNLALTSVCPPVSTSVSQVQIVSGPFGDTATFGTRLTQVDLVTDYFPHTLRSLFLYGSSGKLNSRDLIRGEHLERKRDAARTSAHWVM